MRNIAAEKKFLETMYLMVGILFNLGVIVGAIGAELWLIFSYHSLGLPLFLILQGAWCLALSFILGFMANVWSKELAK